MTLADDFDGDKYVEKGVVNIELLIIMCTLHEGFFEILRYTYSCSL